MKFLKENKIITSSVTSVRKRSKGVYVDFFGESCADNKRDYDDWYENAPILPVYFVRKGFLDM